MRHLSREGEVTFAIVQRARSEALWHSDAALDDAVLQTDEVLKYSAFLRCEVESFNHCGLALVISCVRESNSSYKKLILFTWM